MSAQWGLALHERLPGATCSEVYAGVDRHGREIVLKMPRPAAEERSAIVAMRAFATVGGVKVYKHDEATGATLQPRIRPGTNLLDVSEDEAIEVCASLILRMRELGSAKGCVDPYAHSLSLRHWFRSLLGCDRDDVGQAKRIAIELLESTTEPVLLHGDLHHENVLRDGNGWTFIDPKGIVGDRSFEVTAFMRNPLCEGLSSERLQHRLDKFADLLGDPVERLWGWSYAEAVLNSLWAEEDGDDPRRERGRSAALLACAPNAVRQ